MALHSISICSGIGGLDLGVARVLDTRTVCYIEREVSAAEILVARMEDGSLDAAPIYSDLGTFDGKPWRGRVDLITAGLPCQPFSVAGQRKGDQDERFIWNDFFRIVDECQPAAVFIENVPGIVATLTLGHRRTEIARHFDAINAAAKSARDRWRASYHLERLHRRLLKPYGISMALFVCCELESRGYQVEAGLFRASEVGAPHKRERFFCLGVAKGDDQRRIREHARRREVEAGGSGVHVADSISEGLEERGCKPAAARQQCAGATLADSGRQRSDLLQREVRGEPTAERINVAHRPSRGLGELRESPRSDGLSDGRDKGVENAGSGLCREGRTTGPGEEAGGWAHDGPSGPSAVLGQPASARHSAGERGQSRRARDEARGPESDGRRDAVAKPGAVQPEQFAGVGTRPGEAQGGRSPSEFTGRGNRFPPGPNDHETWSDLLVSEPWMRPALSQAEAESLVCRDSDGIPARLDRTARLRALGNAVVPEQAAYALRELLNR